MIQIHHSMRYQYARPVALGEQTLRLRPRVAVDSYELAVAPSEHSGVWDQDEHGNWAGRYQFFYPVEELAVDVAFSVSLDRSDCCLDPSPLAIRLNRDVNCAVTHCVRMEPGVQEPDETLERGSGSCRDLAWLLIRDLRRAGMEARFVSGYLIGNDAIELHAWAEVQDPSGGWIGLDPTLGALCGPGHLPLAVGRHYSETAPISGAVEPVEVEFYYEVSVAR